MEASTLSSCLSVESSPCLVLESMSSRRLVDRYDPLLCTVALGDFSFSQDRLLLAPLVRHLLGERQVRALRQREWLVFRVLESARAAILDEPEVPKEPFRDWMRRMRFTNTEDAASGWSPLRFAVYANVLEIARELLGRGADVHAPLRKAQLRWGEHTVGSTILHGLSIVRDLPKAVVFLMQNRADPCAADAAGRTTLHFALLYGRCENAEAIMRRRPEAADTPCHCGVVPWAMSFYKCQTNSFFNFRHRYPYKVDADPNHQMPLGLGVLQQILLIAGDVDTLGVAIDAGYDVNHVSMPTELRLQAQCASAQAVCYATNDPSESQEFLANNPGITPLMLAAFLGNVPCVELLIANRADVQATNSYRRNALTHAALRGHMEVGALLLDASTPLDVVDTWGRTALQWAEKRGWLEMAALIRDGEPRRDGQQHLFCRCECRDATVPPRNSSRHTFRLERSRLYSEDPSCEEMVQMGCAVAGDVEFQSRPLAGAEPVTEIKMSL